MDEVVFGRYRLLSLIGQGGMGKVYRAHDTMIGRDVAVKVLPTELSSEPGYRARFKREAHTAARLTEPHIIPIFDTGEIDGQLYLVMPIIEGTDVQALLQSEGPLSPPRAVHVIEQLGAALDVAHAAGLVHRDIKPSNALVTARDFVYLIDFGIAHDGAATRLTSTGMMVGTLAYMAPERFSAGVADARSDVYALACVLHECLTAHQPYPGDSLEQQIAGHLTLDPPRPSEQRSEVPTGLDEVIAAGMAKDPERRYQSGHELAAAARSALTTAPSRVPRTAARLAPTRPVPPPGPGNPAEGDLNAKDRPPTRRGYTLGEEWRGSGSPQPVGPASAGVWQGRPPMAPPPPANRPAAPPVPAARRGWWVAAAAVVVLAIVSIGVLVAVLSRRQDSQATTAATSSESTARPATLSAPATGPATSSAPAAPASQYFKTPWGTSCEVTAQRVTCQNCVPGQHITNAYTCTDPAPARAVDTAGTLNESPPDMPSAPGAQQLSSGPAHHANGWAISVVGGWVRFTNDATGHGMAVAAQNRDVF